MRASILSIATALACQFTFSSQANSSEKSELVSECLQHIETGDLDAAKEVAVEVLGWRHLFATKLIKDAEVCLSQATNEQWKYMPTKSRFLTGQALTDELVFIEGASGRKQERKVLECEKNEVLVQLRAFRQLAETVAETNALEVQFQTYEVCRRLYEDDPDETLLKVSCNQVFSTMGLPGTSVGKLGRSLAVGRKELRSELLEIMDELDEFRRQVRESKVTECGS